MSTASDKITDIINQALISNHPLVKEALEEEKAFRQQTEKEIKDLIIKTQQAVLREEKERVKFIKETTLACVNLDLELATQLNKALESYKPVTKPDPKLSECIYPLKYNKLVDILAGTQEFLKANFQPLFVDQNKNMPKGYEFKTLDTEVTRIGANEFTIHGNSKNTFLKAALLETYLVSTGKTINDLDLIGKPQNGHWIDGTAIAHIAPLPQNLDLLAIDPRFEKFTWRYHDEITTNGLIYNHSGYAFGGYNRNRFRGDKRFAPEDCSSDLEKRLEETYGSSSQYKPFIFTTMDQLFFYRTKLELSKNVTPEWLKSDTLTHMENTFDVVQNWQQDPQKYIQPGQIYCHRTFNLEKDSKMEQAGSGGHTGLVLGFKSDAKDSTFVILAHARNMPEEEGVGVQECALFPDPANKTLMLFSMKRQHVSHAKLEQTNQDHQNVATTKQTIGERQKK